MDCDLLCPYSHTTYNCYVPSLTKEQVDGIIVSSKLTDKVLRGHFGGQSFLICSVPHNSVCLYYMYPFKIYGSWRCELYDIIIIEDSYRPLNDSILDYLILLRSARIMNKNGQTPKIDKDSILITDDHAIFLEFDKHEQLPSFPSQFKVDKKYVDYLLDINELYKHLGKLPDWTTSFSRFFYRNNEYPNDSDVVRIAGYQLRLERSSYGDFTLSLLGRRYVPESLVTHLKAIYSGNCGERIDDTKFHADWYCLIYYEEDIVGFILKRSRDVINYCIRKEYSNTDVIDRIRAIL